MVAIMDWLRTHEGLSGWAQFAGTGLALLLTYLTAFAPGWRRKRQLRDEAIRLLMHGYEMIESFHRTSGNFLPAKINLQFSSLTIAVAIEEMGKFPVYELDKNVGSLSFARRLLSMKVALGGVRLLIDTAAMELDREVMTPEQRDLLRQIVGEQLNLARNLLLGVPMTRPTWPTEPATT